MSVIKFEMKPVEKKREGSFMKKSVYDPMIDQFLDSGHDLVEIVVKEKKAAYIKHQLQVRIKKRGLDIVASSSGGFAYLEKKQSESG